MNKFQTFCFGSFQIPGAMVSPATATTGITSSMGTKICGRFFSTAALATAAASVCSKFS